MISTYIVNLAYCNRAYVLFSLFEYVIFVLFYNILKHKAREHKIFAIQLTNRMMQHHLSLFDNM